jgi:hypothetical protein
MRSLYIKNFPVKLTSLNNFIKSLSQDDLAPGDLRQLVKSEEERNQAKLFRRLVPSEKSHKYLQYMERLSYYDKLLDAFEYKYADQKEDGIQRLRSLCDNNRHI